MIRTTAEWIPGSRCRAPRNDAEREPALQSKSLR
jgi:hypothetical protein